MNNIYKRGLFKRFLKEWAEVIFERQQEPTKKILRTFASTKQNINNYKDGDEEWYPRQLSSGENYTDIEYSDLLWKLPKQDVNIPVKCED